MRYNRGMKICKKLIWWLITIGRWLKKKKTNRDLVIQSNHFRTFNVHPLITDNTYKKDTRNMYLYFHLHSIYILTLCVPWGMWALILWCGTIWTITSVGYICRYAIYVTKCYVKINLKISRPVRNLGDTKCYRGSSII